MSARSSEPAGAWSDVRAAWRYVAEEAIVGGARWSYVFGSVLLVLTIVQVVSGTLLAFEYAPTTSSAHESLTRVMDRDQLPWGPLLRGLHHHGSSFLVVLVVAHLVQVAVFGAYRPPRRLNWLTGLAAGGALLALAFTGSLLPWDDEAFFATRVGLNIVRTTPLAGPWLADFLQGGPAMGNLTLTRFFTLHAVVLPAALAVLLLLHVLLMRRHGVTPDPRRPAASLESRVDPFWPHQALLDLVAACAVVAGLLVVARMVPVELGPKADPAGLLDARPEWYFWWLFQLLHHFEPPLDWLATFGIPGLFAAFLALLPWIDRAPDARPSARKLPLGGLALVLVAVGALTLEVALAPEGADEAAAVPTAKATARAVTPLEAGMIYGEKCTECHARDGSPVDPDARDFRTKEFARMAEKDFAELVRVVKQGDDEGIMPPFEEELTDEEIRAVLEQVVLRFPERARKAKPAAPAAPTTPEE